MGLQSSSMAAIQMTSLVSMTCWACLSLPLVMGPSSASWSLPLVVSSSLCWAFLSMPLVMGPSSASWSLSLVVSSSTFPVSFMIMDIEEDTEIPLILGRPFMLTANCVVDMGKGNLKMSVDDHKVTFNLFEAMKHPSDHKACFKVEKVEHEVDMVARAMVLQSPLEKALTNTMDCLTKEEEKELQNCLEELEGLEESSSEKVVFEELKKDIPAEKDKVELKILLEHLKYVF